MLRSLPTRTQGESPPLFLAEKLNRFQAESRNLRRCQWKGCISLRKTAFFRCTIFLAKPSIETITVERRRKRKKKKKRSASFAEWQSTRCDELKASQTIPLEGFLRGKKIFANKACFCDGKVTRQLRYWKGICRRNWYGPCLILPKSRVKLTLLRLELAKI